MGIMSEIHQDLESIHTILLGQRKVAHNNANKPKGTVSSHLYWQNRVECIDELLLEFEAAGVVWPDNIEVLHV